MKKIVIGVSAVVLAGFVSAIGGAIEGVSRVCGCSRRDAAEKIRTTFLGEKEEEGTVEEIKEEN